MSASMVPKYEHAVSKRGHMKLECTPTTAPVRRRLRGAVCAKSGLEVLGREHAGVRVARTTALVRQYLPAVSAE